MSNLVQLECERAGYNPEPNVPLEVVSFWAGRGIEIDPYGPPLVSGLPQGFDSVSFRRGRTTGRAIDHKRISVRRRKLKIPSLPPIPEFEMDAKPSSKRALERNPMDMMGSEKYIADNFGDVDSSLMLNQIIRLVGHCHGYSVDQLKGQRRFKRLSIARQQAFWHMYHRTDASYPQIGKFMGGRDHTSVMHGCKAHETRIAELAA